MIRLREKPKHLLHAETFSFFVYKNEFYFLGKDGYGYKGELVDGRTVHSFARKVRTCPEHKTKYNLMDEYNQIKDNPVMSDNILELEKGHIVPSVSV
jgi:hypothetical protein